MLEPRKFAVFCDLSGDELGNAGRASKRRQEKNRGKLPALRGFLQRQRERQKQAIRPARFEEVEARREQRPRRPRNKRHGRPRGR